MARFLVIGLVAALLAAAPQAAGAQPSECWGMVYDAIRKSAASPTPAVTSYTQRGLLIEDGIVRQRDFLQVAYHSDGTAFLQDPTDIAPRETTRLQPGPPLLGPYGDGRSAWLGSIAGDSVYPMIATVKTHPNEPCVNLGLEEYQGSAAYHIVLPEASVNAPSLRAIWLDPATGEIRKTIVGGMVWLSGTALPPSYPSFEVEFQHIGAYNVVRHITWKYRWRVFKQYSVVFGEYYFTGYSFKDETNGSAA